MPIQASADFLNVLRVSTKAASISHEAISSGKPSQQVLTRAAIKWCACALLRLCHFYVKQHSISGCPKSALSCAASRVPRFEDNASSASTSAGDCALDQSRAQLCGNHLPSRAICRVQQHERSKRSVGPLPPSAWRWP